MPDVEADACTIFVDEREPLLHATEELHVLAEALKGFSGERDIVLLGFFEHQEHIGQDAVGILTLCQFSVSIPEFLLGLSGCLDESNSCMLPGDSVPSKSYTSATCGLFFAISRFLSSFIYYIFSFIELPPSHNLQIYIFFSKLAITESIKIIKVRKRREKLIFRVLHAFYLYVNLITSL